MYIFGVFFISNSSNEIIMNTLFKFFPFDLQKCPLNVESYAYREAQLKIKWHDEHSIEISPDLTLPTFSLVKNTVRTGFTEILDQLIGRVVYEFSIDSKN